MKKKLFAKIISLTLVSALSLNFIFSSFELCAHAEEETPSTEDDANTQIEYLQFSEEEMEMANMPEEKTANVLEKNIDNTIMLDEEANLYAARDLNPNTDPLYAYLATNDVVYQKTLETENEMRWYAFEISSKSKVTILLQMVDSLDADLYMFSYHQSDNSLHMIGGSASYGTGVMEYYNTVLDAGIYYFAISAYEGTGDFAFAFYENNYDADYEINDTSETATSISMDTKISAIIDCPYDVDYYKITVSQPKIMEYQISSSNNYTLIYAKKEGDEASIKNISGKQNQVKIMPGTYYFAVYSDNSLYSGTAPYTITFNTVLDIMDSSISIIGVCKEANIIFQSDALGENCYVNGNKIDISYSYSYATSNSAGHQSYNIKINHRSDVHAVVSDTAARPSAVTYLGSTRPAMSVSNGPALMLMYTSNSDFYAIHCVGTEAYEENTYWDEMDIVQVLVDPSTGKLIDIISVNYFYDIAPVGTNKISIANNYVMTYYRE